MTREAVSLGDLVMTSSKIRFYADLIPFLQTARKANDGDVLAYNRLKDDYKAIRSKWGVKNAELWEMVLCFETQSEHAVRRADYLVDQVVARLK